MSPVLMVKAPGSGCTVVHSPGRERSLRLARPSGPYPLTLQHALEGSSQEARRRSPHRSGHKKAFNNSFWFCSPLNPRGKLVLRGSSLRMGVLIDMFTRGGPVRPKDVLAAVARDPACCKDTDEKTGNTPLHFTCCNGAGDTVAWMRCIASAAISSAASC